jgi:hypothetical protein
MQKNIAAILFTAAIALATPAHASWQTDLQAAIAAGNVGQINSIAAANPTMQGDIAMAILQAASGMVNTNPAGAVSLFQAAAPFASSIPAGQASTAGGYINTMFDAAKSDTFQANNPSEAANIFSTALTLASLPNITAEFPNMYSAILAQANEFLDKKPIESAGTEGLNALLAQQPGNGGPNLTNPQDADQDQDEGEDENEDEGKPDSAV